VVFAAQPVAAAIDFYRGSVPVHSQSMGERKVAAQKAFAEVIVRMSGTQSSLQIEPIQKAQKDALRYVEQFQYAPLDDADWNAEGYDEQLFLQFSPAAIKRLLMETDKFWPVNRPSTLIWLVEDSVDSGKQFVTGEVVPEVVEGFSEAAQERGLPLTYPLLDLQDQMHLSAEQVWRLDEEAILQASKRYDADVVLVGRYSATSQGEYLATWQFFHRGDSRVYDSRNPNSAALGRSALYPLADYLGYRYAIAPSDDASPDIVLQLSGIESFAGFRNAFDYLQGLAAISAVKLSVVRQDTMLLSLNSEADLDKFVNVLTLDGRMQQQESVLPGELPAWQQTAPGTRENPLRYRWLR